MNQSETPRSTMGLEKVWKGSTAFSGRGEPSSASSSPSSQNPHVLSVSWKPKDHVAELTNMLQGVTAEHIERQVVQYVEDKIEPAGWRAVWRVPSNLSNSLFKLKEETCIYVDVIDVSREKLLAEVKIITPVTDSIPKEDLELIEQAKHRKVHVPLVELSVLADQENEALDMVTTAEVICQIKFFYEHIWQPWDLEEESICFNHSLVTNRLKLYQDMQTGCIPTAVSTRLRSIIKEANSVQEEINKTESVIEGDGLDDEMDQKDVAHLFQLHKQLEKLKSQFDVLKDPVLRELATQQPPDEMMNIPTLHAKVKVVAHSLTAAQLAQHMAMLPDLIKSIPQVSDDSLWQTSSSLQNAINTAHEGDVIVLFPGHHILHQLGFLFARCGSIVGLGEGVVVEGTREDGDVLMDVTGNFTFQNITLIPAAEQIGIVQHGGLMTMQKVTFIGGKWGLLGLGSTESSVSDVLVQGCSAGGMDFRDGAKATISASTFKDCMVGLQLEEGAKVSLSNTKIEGSKKHGVSLVLPDGDVSNIHEMSSDTLLKWLLQDCVGNTMQENNEDVVVLASGQNSISSAGNGELVSSPFAENEEAQISDGSLDSGCDFMDTANGTVLHSTF